MLIEICSSVVCSNDPRVPKTQRNLCNNQVQLTLNKNDEIWFKGWLVNTVVFESCKFDYVKNVDRDHLFSGVLYGPERSKNFKLGERKVQQDKKTLLFFCFLLFFGG